MATTKKTRTMPARVRTPVTAILAIAALVAVGWVWLGGDREPSTIGPIATVGERLVIPGADRAAAPPFQAQTVGFSGGSSFNLGTNNNEIVVMFFMAAWCATCEPEARALARIHEKYGTRGVRVLVVDVDQTDSEFELERFSDRIGPNRYLWAMDAGSIITRLYGVQGLDTTIMIDRQGRVAYVDAFPTPYDVLESVVEALL